jgi:rhodanese-related sulfurtransferase
MSVPIDAHYAGDLDPDQAWVRFQEQPNAILIDVRTTAEWSYVGEPDISRSGRDVVKLSWKEFPSMQINPVFVKTLTELAPDKNTTLLFLCRSGVRSKDAAVAMTKHGYQQCYNIEEGFEGDHDNNKQRGNRGGWKLRGLPWTQP